MLELISSADTRGPIEQRAGGFDAMPLCTIHPGSFVRRYRSHGPSGPGVYPQCVPSDGDRPHMLAWPEIPPVPAVRSSLSGLSLSERGVLVDASNGMTVTETAVSRSKSPVTVKTQRRSIMLKLGARNMAQAVGMMSNAD